MKRPVSAVLTTVAAALFIFAGHAPTAAAQDFTIQDDSRIWVDGTSNKSDFTVHATVVDGSASLADDGLVPAELQITVPSAELKSKKSTIMDRLMHDALMVSEHPTISFTLDEAQAAGGGTLKTTGQLTLAGVTNEVEMEVKAEKTDDGGVRYIGTTPLKMTDFDMKPPTAMFGSLRTADEVTVGFDVVFVPSNEGSTR